jgi:lipopolysaccharide transport system permease protein
MIQRIQSIWGYRNFIWSTIITDLRVRFTGSKLGGLWIFLHPLLEIAMYALVLSKLLATRLSGIEGSFSYAIYLTAGTLFWSMFADILLRSLNVFTSNAHLIKKISFPVSCLPLIVSGSALLNNLLLLLAIIVIFALAGHMPTATILLLPVLMLITIVLAASLGLLLGVLNVFVRDIGQVMPVVLQFSFWLTPIVYPLQTIPESYHWLFNFNPMFHLASAYQAVLVFHRWPDWNGLLLVLLLGLGLLALAVTVYRRAKSELVDML